MSRDRRRGDTAAVCGEKCATPLADNGRRRARERERERGRERGGGADLHLVRVSYISSSINPDARGLGRSAREFPNSRRFAGSLRSTAPAITPSSIIEAREHSAHSAREFVHEYSERLLAGRILIRVIDRTTRFGESSAGFHSAQIFRHFRQSGSQEAGRILNFSSVIARVSLGRSPRFRVPRISRLDGVQAPRGLANRGFESEARRLRKCHVALVIAAISPVLFRDAQ